MLNHLNDKTQGNIKKIDCISELNPSDFCDKLSTEGLAELYEFMQKEKKLKEICNLEKIKVRPDDGRNYIYINRQQFVGSNRMDLINKLYAHFFKFTLEGLFPDWLLWRRDEDSVSNKTIKEDIFLWNALFKNTKIVRQQINTITATDFINFFRTMLKKEPMTRKRFNNAKSVLNGLYYYAIGKGIVDHNPLKEINYRQFQYQPVNAKKDIFTLQERQLLLDYLATKYDIYSLAVQLDFYLICRIAELRSLRWSDIEGNFIKLQTQLLADQTMNDDLSFNPRVYKNVPHIKGNTDDGFRYMPLTDGAKKVLKQIRELNPNGEYILMDNGHQLTAVSFNRHLSAFCKEVGIRPRSSHKIRFTVASLLYKNGVPATTLQRLLGHTTLAMTLHYLRDLTPEEDTINKMNAVLG